MSKFAKLFESENHGQILAKIDTNDEGAPEVRFYVNPPELGVCSMALGFSDDDAGWDKAEALFGNVDYAMAVEWAQRIYKQAGYFTEPADQHQ